MTFSGCDYRAENNHDKSDFFSTTLKDKTDSTKIKIKWFLSQAGGYTLMYV
jgi:hypothetical protein